MPISFTLNGRQPRSLCAACGSRANSRINWIQVKCLGGRLREAGARLAHVWGGGNATRITVRGNGTCSTELGKPAAQQQALADEQQPPTQFRLEGAGVSVCPISAFCNEASVTGLDSEGAAW